MFHGVCVWWGVGSGRWPRGAKQRCLPSCTGSTNWLKREQCRMSAARAEGKEYMYMFVMAGPINHTVLIFELFTSGCKPSGMAARVNRRLVLATATCQVWHRVDSSKRRCFFPDDYSSANNHSNVTEPALDPILPRNTYDPAIWAAVQIASPQQMWLNFICFAGECVLPGTSRD